MYCLLVSVVIFFILNSFFLVAKGINAENAWYHSMGNSYNTHRRIPMKVTNFSGAAWQIIFNVSKAVIPKTGMAVGINGDLYLFMSEYWSESRMSSLSH